MIPSTVHSVSTSQLIVICLLLFFSFSPTGIDRYYDNLREMLGYEPSIWWRITWRFITPAICLVVFIYSLYDYQPLKYGLHYVYPMWGELIGWILSFSTMLCIPCYFIYKYRGESGSFSERMGKICRPEIPEIEAEIRLRAARDKQSVTVTPV